jgi:hypothetical protein
MLNFSSVEGPLTIVSFVVFLASSLFFIGLGGAFNAYLRAFLGDDDALRDGYGSLNPFVHISFFWMIIFLWIKFFIRNSQPFSWNFKNGIFGFFQRIIFIFASPIMHLFIASLFLFFSIFFFGNSFYMLAIKTPLGFSIETIKMLKIFFSNISSIKIIFMLFSIYSIVVNVFMAFIDFFLNVLEYFIYVFVFPYYENPGAIFLCYLLLTVIFVIYSDIITIASWKMISLPLIFL